MRETRARLTSRPDFETRENRRPANPETRARIITPTIATKTRLRNHQKKRYFRTAPPREREISGGRRSASIGFMEGIRNYRPSAMLPEQIVQRFDAQSLALERCANWPLTRTRRCMELPAARALSVQPSALPDELKVALDRASDFAKAEKAANTRRAYTADFAAFRAWCAGRRRSRPRHQGFDDRAPRGCNTLRAPAGWPAIGDRGRKGARRDSRHTPHDRNGEDGEGFATGPSSRACGGLGGSELAYPLQYVRD
jgi:hypothetical protein